MNTVKTWAVDTAVRSIKTFAQSLAGLLGFGAIVPASVLHVTWQADLGVAAGAALACLLQNIQSFPTSAIDGAAPLSIPSAGLLSTVSLIGPDSTPDPAPQPDPTPVVEAPVVAPAPVPPVVTDPNAAATS